MLVSVYQAGNAVCHATNMQLLSCADSQSISYVIVYNLAWFSILHLRVRCGPAVVCLLHALCRVYNLARRFDVGLLCVIKYGMVLVLL
jgi:hypothetical protein